MIVPTCICYIFPILNIGSNEINIIVLAVGIILGCVMIVLLIYAFRKSSGILI